ncbi:MAG: hypothetical protein FWE37_00360 [Spirochaetaceae bacterium]|nr:hypothetical protein [Spirochaetaceae bacterium]
MLFKTVSLLFFIGVFPLVLAAQTRQVNVYNGSLQRVSEEIYRDGRLWLRITNTFNEAGQLMQQDSYQDGQLSSARFNYRHNGALWQSISSAVIMYGNNEILTSSQDNFSRLILNSGLLVADNFYENGRLMVRQNYRYNAERQLIGLVSYFAGQHSREQIFNGNLVISEIMSLDGEVTERRNFSYNDLEQLIIEEIEADGQNRLFHNLWQDDMIVERRFYLDNELRQLISFAGNTRSELFYIDGRAVLRVFYVDDILISEELIVE